jgi:hypothetical protein
MNRTTNRFRLSLAALLGALVLSMPPAAQAFGRGETSVALSLGSGQQLGRDYTVVNGRYGYFFVNEFEASLAFETWRGNSPDLYKIIPELRYVYSAARPLKPYAALFVSRTFYSSSVPDHNSFGAKAGAYYSLNANAHVGFGLVYERLESCDAAIYRDCQRAYPEVTLGFTF